MPIVPRGSFPQNHLCETQLLCPDITGSVAIVADFINFRSFDRLLIIRYLSKIGSSPSPSFEGELFLSPANIRPSISPAPCGSRLTRKVVVGLKPLRKSFLGKI
ncbi:hypothetical protein TCAL_16403 [Tigriopus californicus]|uniref:Uncharacterized protein n=1 Tax=Tigriopus californicus TaxID=6832 RepID=A0A553NYD2_TIGCA|nr:hypothetical protein TCAL_16403 [Tigriopus californicus]